MEVSGQFHSLAVLTAGESPDIHWIGGLIGPRAGLDFVEKE
jgi:hypothetical protein